MRDFAPALAKLTLLLSALWTLPSCKCVGDHDKPTKARASSAVTTPAPLPPAAEYTPSAKPEKVVPIDDAQAFLRGRWVGDHAISEGMLDGAFKIYERVTKAVGLEFTDTERIARVNLPDGGQLPNVVRGQYEVTKTAANRIELVLTIGRSRKGNVIIALDENTIAVRQSGERVTSVFRREPPPAVADGAASADAGTDASARQKK